MNELWLLCELWNLPSFFWYSLLQSYSSISYATMAKVGTWEVPRSTQLARLPVDVPKEKLMDYASGGRDGSVALTKFNLIICALKWKNGVKMDICWILRSWIKATHIQYGQTVMWLELNDCINTFCLATSSERLSHFARSEGGTGELLEHEYMRSLFSYTSEHLCH